MTDRIATPQPEREPGVATAENGVVILDGPDGVAVTMTSHAAALTGHSLISAAEEAARQTVDGAGAADTAGRAAG
ncbi:hypothetical protein [Sphingomonas zeicaulis]|uniref:hypothetical protein n=1 Tax=Sphingomonas zeicaulis TaxID=1632740 RepID=UPI003D25BE90